MGERVLREVKQYVTLVLVRVQATFEFETTRLLVKDPSCVMTGGDVVVLELTPALLQCRELNVAIAVDARVRRFTAQVTIAEAVNHVRVERAREIVNVMGDSQLQAYLAGIFRIL